MRLCISLSRHFFPLLMLTWLLAAFPGLPVAAQTQCAPDSAREIEQLQQTVRALAARVAALEERAGQPPAASAPATAGPDADPAAKPEASAAAAAHPPAPQPAPAQPAPSPVSEAASSAPLEGLLPAGATLNFAVDGYYEYNLNQPVGRVNLLRAYDVLSNSFSISQADIVFELPADIAKSRRYGARVDLQFGQATGATQGNPSDEPRPALYRNLFQAYGRYIAPVGQGLTVDFGKWASPIGIEGNYTKDQMNYSRSYLFAYLPSYHMGVRAAYPVTSRLGLTYAAVNGLNQAESFGGFKGQLVSIAAAPAKQVSWTVNYFLGQEHADTEPASGCKVPLQPGLCVAPVVPAPDGRTHIFDSYATWQASQKLTLALEGDYVISRLWRNAAPGESSAPSHLDGGAAYGKYQFTPRVAFALRGEYLSDRGGLFSGTTQALKEGTGTLSFQLGPGVLAMMEFRHDWSNQPYFYSSTQGSLKQAQTTAGVGLVWWFGGKQGSW